MEVITKEGDLPYNFSKLVLDSLRRASSRKIPTKNRLNKKAGTKLYVGAPLLLARKAYRAIGETNQLLVPLMVVPNVKEGRPYKRTIKSPAKSPRPSKKMRGEFSSSQALEIVKKPTKSMACLRTMMCTPTWTFLNPLFLPCLCLSLWFFYKGLHLLLCGCFFHHSILLFLQGFCPDLL